MCVDIDKRATTETLADSTKHGCVFDNTTQAFVRPLCVHRTTSASAFILMHVACGARADGCMQRGATSPRAAAAAAAGARDMPAEQACRSARKNTCTRHSPRRDDTRPMCRTWVSSRSARNTQAEPLPTDAWRTKRYSSVIRKKNGMINVRYLHFAETEARLEVGRSRHALAKLRLLGELAMLGARLASRRQSLRKTHRRRGQVRASVHGGDNTPRNEVAAPFATSTSARCRVPRCQVDHGNHMLLRPVRHGKAFSSDKERHRSKKVSIKAGMAAEPHLFSGHHGASPTPS